MSYIDTDLDKIIEVCQKLRKHPERYKWNNNRAYYMLLTIQNEFENELEEMEKEYVNAY